MYWLTGSQQFHLMSGVSESLAGRVGIVNLLGFSHRELESNPIHRSFLPTEQVLAERDNSRIILLPDLYKRIWYGCVISLAPQQLPITVTSQVIPVGML